PPSSGLCAFAAAGASQSAQASAIVSATILPPCPTPTVIVASRSACAIAGIGGRTVGIPAASLAQVAYEITQIRFVQGVSVGGHSRPAVSNLVRHAVVADRRSRDQCCALIKSGELRDVLGELVMAEPALVIEDFLPALGPALGTFSEFIDLQRSLIGVLRSRLGCALLRSLLCRRAPGDRACRRRQHRRRGCDRDPSRCAWLHGAGGHPGSECRVPGCAIWVGSTRMIRSLRK